MGLRQVETRSGVGPKDVNGRVIGEMLAGSAGARDKSVCAFEFSAEGLGEGLAFGGEHEEVFLGLVVEHLDGGALEDVLQTVALDKVLGLATFALLKLKVIDGVYLNALGDVHPLLGHVLAQLISAIVALEGVDVEGVVGALELTGA